MNEQMAECVSKDNHAKGAMCLSLLMPPTHPRQDIFWNSRMAEQGGTSDGGADSRPHSGH